MSVSKPHTNAQPVPADHLMVRIVGSVLGRDSGTVPSLTGFLHIAADGVRAYGEEREWFIPYARLTGLQDTEGTLHVLSGDRVLMLRVSEPERVRSRIEHRVAAYRRAAMLYRLEAKTQRVRQSSASLFALFENPAAPADVRVDVASWIARGPLQEADLAYVRRVIADVGDSALAQRLREALALT